MARPSIETERLDEILDAFEMCILRHGVEAVTLQDIADRSNLSRPLIRHHGGNKRELIETLINRFMRDTLLSLKRLQDKFTEDTRIETIFNDLFDPWAGYRKACCLAGHFLVYGKRVPSIGERFMVWNDGLLAFLQGELSRRYPAKNLSEVEEVSFALASLLMSPVLPLQEDAATPPEVKFANLAIRLAKSFES